MKKLLALLLAMLMVLSLFAGCGGKDNATSDGNDKTQTSDKKEDKTEPEELGLVGFSTVSMSESIYVLQEAALKEVFDGKATVQTASCDQDAATQIQHIKNFALMGADLIVINPTDVDALADAIKEAHDAGCKIYINGATTDSLSEEYYECCTVSDEYLCGAYVAMIAKNWIEAHADQLNAANPNWEIAFLESSLADETLKRTYGIESIIDPYLKDWEGNYVDASGNIVDESKKVENPAYCQLAADHYKGAKVEQDQMNGGLNVANILTTNPNTRVFLAYNSLASTQGGQYIVDNYRDQIDNFAFFSAGVMGNEADYIVGSVSDTDGVLSIMRGAVQFGVSAAGNDVADSVANTAYAIMYGEEGVDYFKKNPDGIAAWWAVEEDWAPDGVASVAHFNILSGATVQPFDPIETLTDENTVYYWNSKDGFIVEEKEEEPAKEDDKTDAPAAEGEVYKYNETNAFGLAIAWTLILKDDGTYVLSEINDFIGEKAYEGSSYTKEGSMVVCGPMKEGPGQFDWANPAGFTVQLGKGVFAPEGVELAEPAGAAAVPAGEYTFMETTPFGEMKWTITLNDDGTAVVAQPENATMGNPTWTAVWTDNGDGTYTTAECVGSGPQIAGFWENNAIVWQLLNEGMTVPVKYDGYDAMVAQYGIPVGGASAGIAAGEYLFMENTPFGEMKWTVTLNADGSFIVAQPENATMGNPTWTGTAWVDNGDGTFATPDCQGSGPQIASFWKDNGIVWIDNGDGTVTPVGYEG